MKAFQLIAHGSPGRFELRDVSKPEPKPGEVVVRIHACGLNRLDLWLESAGLPIPIQLPRTPGGEIAGVISALGNDVTDWRVGDPVTIQSNLFCGECEFCRRGEESLCLKGELVGVTRDGGFAAQVSVPERALVPIPEGVDFTTAAALNLAGSTAMHMLTDRTSVRPGDWVLVMAAASGVGSAAIQIARGMGARVITTGSTVAKRQLGESLDAEAVVDTTRVDWPDQVRRITGRRGVDIVVEHVGGPVLGQCFECLARGGSIVTCGATAGRDVHLNLWPLFVKQQQLVGSYGRTRSNIRSTLEWAAAGRLKPVIDRAYPLTEAAEAFARLRTREALGKQVIEIL